MRPAVPTLMDRDRPRSPKGARDSPAKGAARVPISGTRFGPKGVAIGRSYPWASRYIIAVGPRKRPRVQSAHRHPFRADGGLLILLPGLRPSLVNLSPPWGYWYGPFQSVTIYGGASVVQTIAPRCPAVRPTCRAREDSFASAPGRARESAHALERRSA